MSTKTINALVVRTHEPKQFIKSKNGGKSIFLLVISLIIGSILISTSPAPTQKEETKNSDYSHLFDKKEVEAQPQSKFRIKEPNKKVLDVPYIYQLDAKGGDYACASTSVASILSYSDKLPADTDLAKILTEQDLDSMPTMGNCTRYGAGIMKRIAHDQDGWGCLGSHSSGVAQFMASYGYDPIVYTNHDLYRKGWDSVQPLPTDFSFIRSNIDAGKPMALAFRLVGPNGTFLDHMITVIGYDGDSLVVNDSYTNIKQTITKLPRGAGEQAVYDIDLSSATLVPSNNYEATINYIITF